MKNNKLTSAQI